MDRPPVSILLPTFNNAGIIRETLESVTWADEILVVDSFSTDETLAICQEYGARILQHEYVNSAVQKNWAVPQCRHPWVFQIDTDEVMTPALCEEVERAIAGPPPDVHAYRIPRRNHMLGRWLRFGGYYPDYQVRLFRRDYGRWIEREVHAHIAVPGEIRTLRNDLMHYGMPSIAKQLCNLDRYTRYEADELHKNGVRFRWHRAVLRPWGVFLYRFLWLGGCCDGWRGFVLSGYAAVYSFFTQVKLWELDELGLERSPR